MSESLPDIQGKTGAIFDAAVSVPVSFCNDAMAIQAARQGVALCDRSHWGRIQLSDSDRLNFLHNQSTNDFKLLKSGQGTDTIFVTSTARTIDLATAYVLDDTVLVVVSPNRREYLLQWLDRYIFFGDKVTLTDVTTSTAMFSLIGTETDAVLQQLGADALVGQPYGNHVELMLVGHPVRIAVGSGLALPGYTLIMDSQSAADVWQAFTQVGAVPMGDRAWEQLRIEQGRPMPDQELTEDFNAVEACLWQAISLNKGCYIGQETIARLDTYKGVKQQIWGIRLQQAADLGTPITVDNEKAGILTSLTETNEGWFGLGYVRTKVGGSAGLTVQVGESQGELVDVPFLQRERQSP
ncbi:YgfZ/GcvT domain-containing protein [Pantanalinema sp. GBBB05]|uniref:CAF17-like 4Fe-4S cluster assembly/insertion protein YgfZ n=1 Tax=Pantanalinema sp. GBBB05 TaxID=2604139 RepID=UPI001DFB16BD|nr:folate-binding protein YgfZ [Pantanalinema sp. GBBB05]